MITKRRSDHRSDHNGMGKSIQQYSGAKGVPNASVVSMITKRSNDLRSNRNVLEWESRFSTGLNTANNTDISKNASNKNCSELIS